MTRELVAIGGLSYLIGSIPSGYLLGLVYRVDVRATGSGNIGATNVARSVGAGAGLATLAIDVAKGAVPVLLVGAIDLLSVPLAGLDLQARALAAVSAACGHVFSVFLRFRGGKGVATTFGALLALAPAAALGALLIFAAALALTRIVSIASMTAAVAAPLWSVALGYPSLVSLAAGILAALIVFRHRANIARLRAGTEPTIGSKRRVED